MTNSGTRADGGYDAAPADRQWRRSVRLLGLAAAGVAVVGTWPDLDRSVAAALLFAGLALWLVELLATPTRGAVELGLVAAVGACGGVLNGVAPDSAGFLFAYFAAAALGVRFDVRRASPALAAVLVVLAGGILVGHRPHTTTSLTTSLLGVAFAFAVATAARSARIANARSEALVVELEASRAAQAQAAALAERARLAREIHDILAHALSGQVMSLEAARMLAERTHADPRLVTQIDRAHRLARSGLLDTRGAIGALRGDVLPGPDLLPDLVDQAGATHGIRATLDVCGTPGPLAADAGLTIYRTAQEALTNTAKYAGRGATTDLTLTWAQDSATLVAADTRGPTAAPPVPSGGYGLTGLRERAELAGGTLTAEPTPTGFTLRLTVPYAHEAALT